MKEKTYIIETYGCQLNESDSEHFAGQLEQLGYRAVTSVDDAEVILLNTCCVRESAENKVYGKIGELKHLKEQNPERIIAVTGCMAQKNQDAMFKRAPHIDLIVGTQNIHLLTNMIKKREDHRGHYMEVEMDGFSFQDLPAKRVNNIFAWVPIMNGCNKFCTYCIVPYVRGREISRSVADIVQEIHELDQQGYREITLLGQNVNSYGHDFNNGTDFSTLLRAINDTEHIRRIRYMTSHPKDMTKEMITTISECDKVVSQIHLPIQSGSNALLKKMNRGYTREHYLDLIAYVREVMPDATLTTDLIVGFPGETEEMHQETLDLLKQVQYDMAYTFIYSRRSGTPAATMENQIPLPEKKRRLQELLEVQNEISLALNKKMEGHSYDIIVEGPTRNDPNNWYGRTSGNKMILWPKQANIHVGDVVQAMVDTAQTWILKGHIVK